MEFEVPGMTCGHCTAAIKRSVQAVDPVATVDCDLGKRRVKIDSALTPVELGAAIEDAGYEARPLTA